MWGRTLSVFSAGGSGEAQPGGGGRGVTHVHLRHRIDLVAVGKAAFNAAAAFLCLHKLVEIFTMHFEEWLLAGHLGGVGWGGAGWLGLAVLDRSIAGRSFIERGDSILAGTTGTRAAAVWAPPRWRGRTQPPPPRPRTCGGWRRRTRKLGRGKLD